MKRLIVDLNSMLNAALLGGKDPDGWSVSDENGKQVQVNSALYGVERFFDALVATLREFASAPMNVIGVWDGLGAKQFRQARLPGYKVGRDKNPAVHEQLSKAREQVNEMLRNVGVTCVTVEGREADDVIAYLTQRLRDTHNVVVSGDGDMAVLVDDNTSVWAKGQLNANPFGPFPHRFITLYKALVGDASDKIPGAPGFGDVAWCEMYKAFGEEGLDDLVTLILEGKLHKLQEDLEYFPKFKAILNNPKSVVDSWWAAELHPEEVNTLKKPLVWAQAMARDWHEVPADLRAPAMREWYGTKLLVTAQNYEAVKKRLQTLWVKRTPFVALDIETSSCETSDEWLMQVKSKSAKGKIDPLGHNLTGMSLTFGDNCQHTIYMSVDHALTDNITVDQCREMVEVFEGVPMVAHNRAFEFQVLYRTWGGEWKDNGWHGFLPNCMDTLIEASYVDENIGKGLKLRSKVHLGYEQQTYEDVTTLEGPLDVILPGGEVIEGPFTKTIKEAVWGFVEGSDESVVVEEAVTEDGWYRKQYRMNELTAQRVLNYGCDDTICTAWLHNWFYLVMQIEGTWGVYQQVEILPQYLTSLAFVQGCRIDRQRLLELEKEDKAAYDTNWAVLRDFLFTKGWAGTTKPVFEEITTKVVKEVVEIVIGEEFSTRKKKLPAVAEDLRTEFPDSEEIASLAAIVEQNAVVDLNKLVDRHFDGEPKINFDSPRQMQKLLYEVIGMTPRLYNKLTAKEKQDPAKVEAFNALRRINKGATVEVKPEWPDLWISKSSTDDDAVSLALAKDPLAEDARAALQAFVKIKEVSTRLKMFYTPYKVAPHWTDKLIHSEMNQCEAATRRYSSSGPNLQQLPAKGEGIKFRTLLLPHDKDAIMVSLDFQGQELVLMAEVSGDEALTSCYVGENLKDGHSLIAVAAAPTLWGEHITYDEFMAMRKSKDPAVAERANALRSSAKTVNFATQFGAMAPKVAIGLKSTEEEAQKFIDAKDKAFPRINQWKEEATQEANDLGYALTLLGARRHLSAALRHAEGNDASRGERQAINYRIQGSAAEQSKLAMGSMWKRRLFTGKYDAQFIAPIHDETVSSVHRKDAVKFIREAHECMVQKYADMKIPMKSSLAIGRDFSCPIEIGTEFTDEQVQEAIDKLFAE